MVYGKTKWIFKQPYLTFMVFPIVKRDHQKKNQIDAGLSLEGLCAIIK